MTLIDRADAHAAAAVTEPAAPPTDRRRLAWLAVGTFALGTENLVVGAMLTSIADDLAVTVALAGLLVSAFALTYAIAAPLMGVLASRIAPKVVLVTALGALAAIDIAAAASPTFVWLFVGRVLAAVAAAAYTPNALALAGSLVAAGERGRATAIVYGGLAAATLVGVPAATLAAATLGWRTTFAGVGVIAALAAIGVATKLPAAPRRPANRVRDWVTVVRLRPVRATLVRTLAVYAAQFVAFAFIAPIVDDVTNTDGSWIALAMFAFGVTAIIGNQVGGRLTDALGPDRVGSASQTLIAAGLAGLSTIALLDVDGAPAVAMLVVAMGVWGLGAWSFNPPQQVRLLADGGALGPLALAANSTALYAGIALGGVLGAVAVAVLGVASLGLLGAAIVGLAATTLRP